MSEPYKRERLDALLDDISDLKVDKNQLNDVFLVKVATALSEAKQSNNVAALQGLLTVLESETVTVADFG